MAINILSLTDNSINTASLSCSQIALYDNATNTGSVSAGFATFYDTSVNDGYIQSSNYPVSFSFDSQNNGTVGSDALFFSNAANSGTILGDAAFQGDSSNTGTIVGDITVVESATSTGVVSGTTLSVTKLSGATYNVYVSGMNVTIQDVVDNSYVCYGDVFLQTILVTVDGQIVVDGVTYLVDANGILSLSGGGPNYTTLEVEDIGTGTFTAYLSGQNVDPDSVLCDQQAGVLYWDTALTQGVANFTTLRINGDTSKTYGTNGSGVLYEVGSECYSSFSASIASQSVTLYLQGNGTTFSVGSTVYQNSDLTQLLDNGTFVIGGTHYVTDGSGVASLKQGWDALDSKYYIDGIVTNLDSNGNSIFNSGPGPLLPPEGQSLNTGEYQMWNNQFYQNGTVFTGTMYFDAYQYDQYYQIVGTYTPGGETVFADGIGTINFYH